MRASRSLALAAALAALACDQVEAPDPVPRSVEPARGYVGGATPVTIRGDGFAARSTQSTSGGSAQVDVTHRAWLAGTELAQVTWIDEHTLSASVPPGLSVGVLPLVVENAYGRRGTLDRAFEVVASPGASLSVVVELDLATVSVGQTFGVSARVTNIGFADATGVTASLAPSGAGAASVLGGSSPPSVAALAPGDTATFTWGCLATGAGNIALAATAAGTDAFSGLAIDGLAATSPLVVELPAAPVATVVASAPRVSVGQELAITFTLSNGGTAPAIVTDVEPTFTPGLAVTCSRPVPAPPRTLASGESAAWTWACTAGAAGALALSGTATGTDANSGAPLSVTPAAPAAITVDVPAALEGSVALPPGTAMTSVGQAVLVTLTVADTGGAAASVTSVTPTVLPPSAAACGSPSPAPPVAVAGRATVQLTWTCTPAAAGSVALGATLAGVDANSGAPLSATAPGVSLLVQAPASIASFATATPATASVGQPIAASLVVTNVGEATANVTAVTPSTSGTSAATCGPASPAPPVALPSGQVRTFSWSCTPSSAGTLSLSATAAGADANSGAAISTTPSVRATVAVQAAAAPAVAAFSATPATVSTDQAVAVSLTVSNLGGAAATVTAVTPSWSPTAGASCSAATPAPPLSIAGGATRTFGWTCTATAAGARQLGVSATAADVNSGAITTLTPPPLSITVQRPAALAVASFGTAAFAVDVGQAFPVALTLSNTGEAGASVSGVSPSLSPSAGTSCSAVSPAPPQLIAGGTSRLFGWSCTSTTSGAALVRAAVTATDVDSGATLSVAVPDVPLAVQTPAALSATLVAPGNPTSVLVGSPVGLLLTVTDAGQAGATLTAVTPRVTPAGAAACTGPAPIPPIALAGGTSTTFSWSCTPSVAGTMSFGASVAGTDANTGTAVAATPGVDPSVVATIPAVLVATVGVDHPVATAGQALAVSFTLTNGGTGAANVTALAQSVSGPATCGSPSPALPLSIAAGASQAFAWTCTGTAAGQVALSALASGVDASTGASISTSPAAPATVTVQTAPAPAASTFAASRPVADTGQAMDVSLTLTNSGGATAILGAIAPSFSPDGAGTCTEARPATPVALPGGGSAAFTWSCKGTTPGSAGLGVTVAASDANTGGPVAVAVTPIAVTIQGPASLAATPVVASPLVATLGQAVSVSLTLSNDGGAGAVVSSVGPTVSPRGAAACGTPSPPGPVTIAGGASRTFTWSCAPSVAGSVTLGATVAAIDANTGAVLAVAPGTAIVTALAPAALSAAVALAGNPTTVSTGVPVAVTLTVTDVGGAGATVTSVTPTTSGTALATCGTPAPSPPLSLAAGTSATFTWSCTATATGSLTLGAQVAGVDAVSGASLSAAAGATVTVQSPASLQATLAAGRSVASVGQAVAVTISVTNGGTASAVVSAVAPSASGAGASCGAPTPAVPIVLPGGQVATFSWACTGTAPGTMTLGATVSGSDGNSGAPLAASAVPVPVTVQSAASLSVISLSASRTTADVGQRVDLSMTVANVGGATAQLSAVTASVDPAGAATCTAPTPAPPQVIAGGSSLTFGWSCTPTVAGATALGAAVRAIDANSGAPADVTAAPASLAVQTPASISPATVAATPLTALVGQAITASLTLVNAGGATASVSAVTPSVSPPASVTCTAAAPATPVAIGGGASTTFTWTCTASSARSPTLRASVSATDANTGAALTVSVTGVKVAWATAVAAPASSALVVAAPTEAAPEVIPVSADALGDGTPSGTLAAFGGRMAVGPVATGEALVAFDPTLAASPERLSLALSVDAGATPASNAAWLASAPATTIGAPGCEAGTAACGPDGEVGLAAAASGAVAGVERLVLVGTGSGRYLYVASSAAAPLEATFVDVRAALDATVASPAVGLVVSSTRGVVLAIEAGAAGPRVFSLAGIPGIPGAQGADVAPGSGLVDLGAPSAAGGGAPILAEVAGLLYSGAAGGIARQPMDGVGWRAATPSDPAWATRRPVPRAGRWPGDLPVPALVPFDRCGDGPCVTAARNVAGLDGEPPSLPQLWTCSPTAGAGACAPGDWILVAPDPADPQVTRLGAPGHGPVSMLAATARWLYVGIDDPSGGARLYRASRTPRAAADLLGHGGCSAADTGCEGLGGNGLGVGATRIAGAVRLDAGSVPTLWILAGDGSGPLQLLRVAD